MNEYMTLYTGLPPMSEREFWPKPLIRVKGKSEGKRKLIRVIRLKKPEPLFSFNFSKALIQLIQKKSIPFQETTIGDTPGGHAVLFMFDRGLSLHHHVISPDFLLYWSEIGHGKTKNTCTGVLKGDPTSQAKVGAEIRNHHFYHESNTSQPL